MSQSPSAIRENLIFYPLTLALNNQSYSFVHRLDYRIDCFGTKFEHAILYSFAEFSKIFLCDLSGYDLFLQLFAYKMEKIINWIQIWAASIAVHVLRAIAAFWRGQPSIRKTLFIGLELAANACLNSSLIILANLGPSMVPKYCLAKITPFPQETATIKLAFLQPSFFPLD